MCNFVGTRAEREWLDTLRRIADALERLVDALEREQSRQGRTVAKYGPVIGLSGLAKVEANTSRWRENHAGGR